MPRSRSSAPPLVRYEFNSLVDPDTHRGCPRCKGKGHILARHVAPDEEMGKDLSVYIRCSWFGNVKPEPGLKPWER